MCIMVKKNCGKQINQPLPIALSVASFFELLMPEHFHPENVSKEMGILGSITDFQNKVQGTPSDHDDMVAGK